MSWVPVPEGSDFPLHNLPYGVFSREGELPRVGVAIGDQVLDLHQLTVTGAMPDAYWFAASKLNTFMGAGPRAWFHVRERVTELLSDASYTDVVLPCLRRQSEVTMHLPFNVSDLVLFQTSIENATNLGRMFQPPGRDPLPPAWRRMPFGQYGRASSVSVSGTRVVRPSGQRKDGYLKPAERLDLSAELGYVMGVPSAPPYPLTTRDFPHHVFGMVLMNVWRALDLVTMESRALGPFLGQSFAVTVSPWVVPLAALNAARVEQPKPECELSPYLRSYEPAGLRITLGVRINGNLVSEPDYTRQYWTGPQLLAHSTIAGAPLRTGDLLATGPVGGNGTLLEMTGNGPFLADGDTVLLTARTSHGVGFGEARGSVFPAV
ncbi:fumarylacetoacetate hydrolase family protein [Nonomuraea sp. NPDC004354]|uniref:fumarylacetoacetate hydrolase family protein n=1 Tax=Nonomuraea sp. NPDC003804 TaxID=3154547 RepID=UPI0033ADDCC4